MPWDEEARLKALDRYGILDTAPERAFDDIAQLASILCGTPIAVVNLIARDRQWFKSEVGLGVRSTPLATSFCAQALLQSGLVVVKDATKDDRFSCNPLVTGEPYLRFYAGAVLTTPEKLPIGTVCVLDHQPRPGGLTSDQRTGLVALGNLVMTHLELRRALQAREPRH
ncbi:GAF domain-containing protein [Phenylobacterium sp. J367]|uniref:GAF domain-containing protein n=1 Tax=Phenylobacterium sp. J367 TaxID=2898435 RepID=UPI0035B40C2A